MSERACAIIIALTVSACDDSEERDATSDAGPDMSNTTSPLPGTSSSTSANLTGTSTSTMSGATTATGVGTSDMTATTGAETSDPTATMTGSETSADTGNDLIPHDPDLSATPSVGCQSYFTSRPATDDAALHAQLVGTKWWSEGQVSEWHFLEDDVFRISGYPDPEGRWTVADGHLVVTHWQDDLDSGFRQVVRMIVQPALTGGLLFATPMCSDPVLRRYEDHSNGDPERALDGVWKAQYAYEIIRTTGGEFDSEENTVESIEMTVKNGQASIVTQFCNVSRWVGSEDNPESHEETRSAGPVTVSGDRVDVAGDDIDHSFQQLDANTLAMGYPQSKDSVQGCTPVARHR